MCAVLTGSSGSTPRTSGVRSVEPCRHARSARVYYCVRPAFTTSQEGCKPPGCHRATPFHKLQGRSHTSGRSSATRSHPKLSEQPVLPLLALHMAAQDKPMDAGTIRDNRSTVHDSASPSFGPSGNGLGIGGTRHSCGRFYVCCILHFMQSTTGLGVLPPSLSVAERKGANNCSLLQEIA